MELSAEELHIIHKYQIIEKVDVAEYYVEIAYKLGGEVADVVENAWEGERLSEGKPRVAAKIRNAYSKSRFNYDLDLDLDMLKRIREKAVTKKAADKDVDKIDAIISRLS